jgi:hypothetical protein
MGQLGTRPSCSAKNIMERPKLAATSMDKEIVKLVNESDHKTLAIWAADCAERVLPYFERNFPEDNRPREAINAGRAWVQGKLRMVDARNAAFAAHAAARDTGEIVTARSAARSAGHAAATAHVPSHAIYAAAYAITTVRDASKTTNTEVVNEEREWQHQHLLELRSEVMGSKGSRP